MLDKKFMKGRDTNMENEEKETAIWEGKQLCEKDEIIKSMIDILAKNNLSIIEAKNILYATSKKICQQKVKASL